MSKMQVKRSINIEAPLFKIYKVISNFNDWQPWSPWLLMEPEVRVTVASDAKSYEWEGKRTGSGNMKICEEIENQFIDYDLNFLKPWKSKAKTSFHLAQEGNTTKVTWKMDSSLPFFLFFMKKMMEAFVGSDYERGLDMLKAYVENGEVPSKIDFIGNKEFSETNWIGIKTDCSLDNIGEKMEQDFTKLNALVDQGIVSPKNTMTIYHKWDIPKGKVSYTAAVSVDEVPENLPDEITTGNIPTITSYALKHTGSYQHLGNAWATLYTMNRNKEIRYNKKVAPFEIYLNDPKSVADKDLETVIYFPTK